MYRYWCLWILCVHACVRVVCDWCKHEMCQYMCTCNKTWWDMYMWNYFVIVGSFVWLTAYWHIVVLCVLSVVMYGWMEAVDDSKMGSWDSITFYPLTLNVHVYTMYCPGDINDWWSLHCFQCFPMWSVHVSMVWLSSSIDGRQALVEPSKCQWVWDTIYWAVLSKALKHSLIGFNALGNVVTVYHFILFELDIS